MIIIFEGPDGAGKTTAAKVIQKKYKFKKIIHIGPIETQEQLLKLVISQNNVIFDRFHLGEQVYGPIYRGKNSITKKYHNLIERALVRKNTIVILALPPFKICFKNWSKRHKKGGEMFSHSLKQVYDAYLSMKTRLPVVKYDYTKQEARHVADRFILQAHN